MTAGARLMLQIIHECYADGAAKRFDRHVGEDG